MGDFTASILDKAKVNLATISRTKATVNPQLNKTPITQRALLTNQTANITEIRNGSGRRCVGLTAYYYQADDTTIPTGSATPIASNCDLTGGDGVGTLSQDYALNYFLKPELKLNDEKCNQNTVFAEDLAFGLANKMTLMAQAFNNNCIAELEANKSVAAGDLPDDVTITGGEYTITGADKWKGVEAADTIETLKLLADLKGLPKNFLIIAGKALRVPQQLSEFHRANDNERSYSLQFGSVEMFNDIDFLDAIVGAEVLYLVDPNVVLSYFYSEYPDTMTPTNDQNNTMIFRLPFQYYDNYQNASETMANVMFMNNGVMEQAYIDVRYQKKCNSSINNNGKVSMDHQYELDLCAMFDFVPVVGANTGIIRVNKAL